jgi:hypothetical protein
VIIDVSLIVAVKRLHYNFPTIKKQNKKKVPTTNSLKEET